MTPRITLPAACLAQLGSLRDDDPPVMWGGPMRAAGKTTMMYDFTHPLCCAGGPVGRILVTQSAPALLRVLARHVGLTVKPGEVPRWQGFRDDHSWRLMTSTTRPKVCAWFTAWAPHPDDAHYHHPTPTLTPDMSPMRALAECFVWLARVERCRASLDVGSNWAPSSQAHAERWEREHDLPEWRVIEQPARTDAGEGVGS